MTLWYLDTSAAIKLLIEEAESHALVGAIKAEDPDLASCFLLETELRRAAQRSEGLTHQAASQLLDLVMLLDMPSSLFREAGYLPGRSLRSLDALHIAAALRINADCVVTYDDRMANAAIELGLRVFAPA